MAKYKLLIIDGPGFVPPGKTGAGLLFEVFSQRYEGGSTLVTSNLPFDEWTGVFGSGRLTGALPDRLTHHVHILEMNGDSYRLNQSQKRRKNPQKPDNPSPWLTRWAHRHPPRCFASRNASAARSSAGPSCGLPGQPPTLG